MAAVIYNKYGAEIAQYNDTIKKNGGSTILEAVVHLLCCCSKTNTPYELLKIEPESYKKLLIHGNSINKLMQKVEEDIHKAKNLMETEGKNKSEFHTIKNLNFVLPPWVSINIDRGTWIMKPGASGRGTGIALSRSLEGILKYVSESISEKSGNFGNMVVQQYIEKPLLVEAKKFDIRQWFLVTSVLPLKIWMFDECYLRFCSYDYDLDNLEDMFIHLTNNSVQKNSPTFQKCSVGGQTGLMWTSKQFCDHYGKAYWLRVKKKMKQIAVRVISDGQQQLHQKVQFRMAWFRFHA